MPDGRLVPVIVNPHARQGRAGRDAVIALRAEGLNAHLWEVGAERPGDLARRALADGARLVVVGGGDGTLAEAATPIIQVGATLGVLPLGTGNTFARNLGLPLDLMDAARVIACGQTAHIDVGEVNGRVFLNSVTLGFSAHVAGALTPQLKRTLGWGAYPIAAVRAVRSSSPGRYTMVLDGVASSVRTRQLIAANAKDVASGLVVPGADYEDGRLVLLVLPGVRPLDALRSAFGWARGNHNAVVWRPFRQVQLRAVSGRVMTVNVDGDLMHAARLHIRARREALAVRVAERP